LGGLDSIAEPQKPKRFLRILYLVTGARFAIKLYHQRSCMASVRLVAIHSSGSRVGLMSLVLRALEDEWSEPKS
jgi:hypothetical protein